MDTKLPAPVLFAMAACSGSGTGPLADTDPLGSEPGVSGDTATTESLPDAGDPGWLDELCQVTLSCPEPLSDEWAIDCDLHVESEEGRVFWDGTVEIWIRGRSSRDVPKHQYRLELHDADGGNARPDLLGMGTEDDWILQGNYYDRSLVRNKLGFDLFQSFGGVERYAAQSACCELELDGEYQGVYTIQERIERDADRIDIEASEEGASFVLKQDTEDCFVSNPLAEGTCWKLVYPDEDQASEAQRSGIRQWLDDWAHAAQYEDPEDPEEGLFTLVDRESAVDIILLEELFKNEDFCWTSLHVWKDVDGLLHFAPWDLDMTLGQLWHYSTYGDPETWIAYRPPMISAMAASEPFRQQLAERWAELRAGPLETGALLGRIDDYQAIMGDAIQRNWDRWDITTVDYGGYFYDVSSYEEEDAWIRGWLEQRLAWMDEHVAQWPE